MADPTNPKQAPQEAPVVQTEALSEADVRKMLNNGKFMDFMAKHPSPDTFDMSDTEAIGKRFESFNTKEGVKKGIIELYNTNLNGDFGIVLSDAEKVLIDEDLEKKAIENPEELLKLQEKLEANRQLPAQIQQLEVQLGALGNDTELAARLEISKKDMENLGKAEPVSGRLGKLKLNTESAVVMAKKLYRWLEFVGIPMVRTSESFDANLEKSERSVDERREALGNVEQRFGKIDRKRTSSLLTETQTQVAAIETQLANIASTREILEGAKKNLDSIRTDLLGQVSGIAEVVNSIESRMKENMNYVFDPAKAGNFSFAEIVKGQEDLERMRKGSESTKTGIDPFANVDEAEAWRILDVEVGGAAQRDMLKAIRGAKVGSKPFDHLEAALKPFLERQKVGTQDGDAARALISKNLKLAADSLGTGTNAMSKRMMIARLIAAVNSSN